MQVRSPPIVYGPHNSCIYCGSTDQLAKEHIIPEGLGGNFLFLKASCRECERQTSRFELHCLRNMLGDFRTATGVRTKRPKSRPTELVLRTSVGEGPVRERRVKIADYPRTLATLKIGRAPILLGQPESDSIYYEVWGATEVGTEGALHQGETYVSQWFKFDQFLLLLAKIGHAYAMASLSADEAATYEQLLPPYIRETIPGFVGHVVGGSLENVAAEPGVIHALQTARETVGSTEYLIVNIRLFAYWGAPMYHAVFGRRPVAAH